MVKLVNTLTITGDPAAFAKASEALTEYMREQPGYLGFELLKSLRRDNVYVEIAEWTDSASHQNAVRSPGFRERVAPLGAVASVDPDVYEVVRTGGGDA